MRKIFLILLLAGISYSQTGVESYGPGKEYNSAFQKLAQGKFEGTVNGVLFLNGEDSPEFIIDFQGSKAGVDIIPDPTEFSDVSTKQYTGYSTSGKSRICYSTYSYSNSLFIETPYTKIGITTIDGACDESIDGIYFTYKSEEETEYLVLTVEKDIILHVDGSYKNKEYTLLKNSVIVFAINRKAE